MGALFQDGLADWTVGRNITLIFTELKQTYFEPVLVPEPGDQVEPTFKLYRVEDSILCKWNEAVTENVRIRNMLKGTVKP
jgi:hypothetical protein